MQDLDHEQDIFTASAHGNLSRVKDIISSNLNDIGFINSYDNQGFTALHWASLNNAFDVASFLIDIGANPFIRSIEKEGVCPFHYSCINGDVNLLNLFINIKNSNLEIRDNNGYTGLVHAIQHGNIETVKHLISKECDFNALDSNSATPLHWSCYMGQLEIVKIFLKMGVNVNDRDNKGRTALHLACVGGFFDVAKLLLIYGSNVLAVDEQSRTCSDLVSEKSEWSRLLPFLSHHERKARLQTRSYWQKAFGSIKSRPIKSTLTENWDSYIYKYKDDDDDVYEKTHTHKLLRFANFSSDLYMFLVFVAGFPIAFLLELVYTFRIYSSPILLILSICLFLVSFYFYYHGRTRNPGFVKKNNQNSIIDIDSLEQTCEYCLVLKPKRSKHCRDCNICVNRFDHHCPWIGNCVGAGNYYAFYGFISTGTIWILLSIIWSVLAIINHPKYDESTSFIVFALTNFGGIVVQNLFILLTGFNMIFLFIYHTYLVFFNYTSDESIHSRRYNKKNNPYSNGLLSNIKDAFGYSPSDYSSILTLDEYNQHVKGKKKEYYHV